MSQINTILTSVIYTLNQVEVKGKANLDSLLGCIQTLEKLKTALEQGDKANETDNQ